MTADSDKSGFCETLKADMRTMEIRGTGPLYMLYSFFRSPDFLAVLIFRISTLFANKGIVGKAIALFFWRLNVLVNSCDVDPAAKIGPGFSLPHPAGIVIGPVVMGRNVKVLQNVTMGAQGGPRRVHSYTGPESRAQIGDNVIIYAGAVVAGGIKIGSGASVGANAVVLRDVPENATAVGVPARIIEKRKESPV